MTDTIFPVLSLDRRHARWEEHLDALTPWENREGIWLKRDDLFAPLGTHGPNGSKMRQLVWYFDRYRGNRTSVVTGASVQSPQLSMSAIVARHYGLETTCVVYSKPETVLRHPNPRIAAGFGATFDYARGPYNPILQSRVHELERSAPTYGAMPLVVPYGISLPQERFTGGAVRDFHEVGARQVSNIPDAVERLIIPAGSCNSLASIVLGLVQDPHNVREIYTIGIGPDKSRWFAERFAHMGVELGDLPFKWRHVSLHDAGYGQYGDKYTGESWAGVDLHPVYEGRLWRWLRTHNPVVPDGRSALWIVGSEARLSVVEPFFTHRPEAR